MIKLEHVVLASPEQMVFIIEGMRNPMNSWEKSDSGRNCDVDNSPCNVRCEDYGMCSSMGNDYILGPNDHSLMQRLANAGTDHRKFMRMMPVYVRITAPLYWWKEFDTYKVGSVANSCSTMHKIQEKEFDPYEDFSVEQLNGPAFLHLCSTVSLLNDYRNMFNNAGGNKIAKKEAWWQMIQLLPSSYNQTRNVMMNYEVLANIYKSRKNHKLDEWRVHKTPEEHEFRNKDFSSGMWGFCDWIESLPYSELIIGSPSLKSVEIGKAAMDGIQAGMLFGEPFPWIREEKEE